MLGIPFRTILQKRKTLGFSCRTIIQEKKPLETRSKPFKDRENKWLTFSEIAVSFRTLEKAIPRRTECRERAHFSAEQRKLFRVYSAEYFGTEF
jgi:hypothetical protein